jgi:hypothetical protein
LDSWTVHETGNGKVTRLFAVDVDTNNKQEHYCYYEYLWCMHTCAHVGVCLWGHAHVHMVILLMRVANHA